jgi:ATP-dependent protease HslVU (ClpYQ) peptidase subunit
MTTCVAVARDGRVATNVYDRLVVGITKIWRHQSANVPGSHGAFLLGYAGDGALPAIVALGLTVKDVPPIDAADDQRDLWAAAMAHAITEQAIESHVTDSGGRLDGNLLLGHDGRVWTLTHMQAIPHRDGRAAVGSGEGLALGAVDAALALGHTDIEAIVTLAVRIGCQRDRYSDGQPQIVTL